jgi:hypothetical protein
MRAEECDPQFLIDNGFLEQVGDFEFGHHTVLASRLGYRITSQFADYFLGRIFETPDAVFTEELLRPDTQDLAMFAAGVDAIVESQRRVALNYFEDGSVEAACPPLQALLHIMAHGHYQEMTLDDPRLRAEFTRKAVLASDWYAARLRARQRRQVALWTRHVEAASGDGLQDARRELARVASPEYLNELVGTIGADPLEGQMPEG